MAATAEEITATRLDRRLEAPNPDDELGRLARALNGMIARLGGIVPAGPPVHRRRRARAAHAAGDPAKRGRGCAPGPRESEQYRTSLEDMLEEIEHLSRLSEDLLLLFREDAGLGAQPREVVRLDQLAREIADDMRVVATEHDQSLVLEPPRPAGSWATRSNSADSSSTCWITRSISLPAGGTIAIEVDCDKNQARLVVSDIGNRHRARAPAAHLRQVLSGGFFPQPAHRGERPRPVDLQVDRRGPPG